MSVADYALAVMAALLWVVVIYALLYLAYTSTRRKR